MNRGRIAVIAVATVLCSATLAVTTALAATSLDAFTAVGGGGMFVMPAGALALDDSNATFQFLPHGVGGIELYVTPSAPGGASYVTIDPPTGSTLDVGDYVSQPVADASHIRMEVGVADRSCGYDNGTLHITELTRDPDTAQITAFAAGYSVTCGSTSANGDLRWHSSQDYVAASAPYNEVFLGTMHVGENGPAQDVTITSVGTLPLQLGAATVGGETPAAFGIGADNCASKTLAAGASCSITVVPHPTAAAIQRGSILLPANVPGGQLEVHVAAEGGFGSITLDSGITFGSVVLGGAGATHLGHLTSTDKPAVTIATLSISGPDAGAFSVTADNCSGVVLHQGNQCDFTVTAHPTALGPQSAWLVVTDNTNASPHMYQASLIGVVGAAGDYFPLAPHRILDTRSGLGAPKAALGAGGVLQLQVAGKGGVAPSGVSAVVLNVTVTAPTAASYLSLYPTGHARPTVSSLNFPRGWTGANNVTVPLGPDGKVNIYNFAGSTQVVADVLGFYAADESQVDTFGYGGHYQPALPSRLLDTREVGTGARVPGGQAVLLLADFGPTVNTHVRALAVNITAVGANGPGYFTAWDGVGQPPTSSTLNFVHNAVVANMTIVPTSACTVDAACAGMPSFALLNGSKQSAHMVVDLIGVFDDGGLPNGLRFHPIAPTRIVDTRIGLGLPQTLGPHVNATVTSPPTVLNGYSWAIAANVTAVAPTASTYLTVWPYNGLPQPTVSTVNAGAGQTVPNAALISFTPGGVFNVYNNAGMTNVLIDVSGMFDDVPFSSPPLPGVASAGRPLLQLATHAQLTSPFQLRS